MIRDICSSINQFPIFILSLCVFFRYLAIFDNTRETITKAHHTHLLVGVRLSDHLIDTGEIPIKRETNEGRVTHFHDCVVDTIDVDSFNTTFNHVIKSTAGDKAWRERERERERERCRVSHKKDNSETEKETQRWKAREKGERKTIKRERKERERKKR